MKKHEEGRIGIALMVSKASRIGAAGFNELPGSSAHSAKGCFEFLTRFGAHDLVGQERSYLLPGFQAVVLILDVALTEQEASVFEVGYYAAG